jgi:peptidoglycan/LPS O-acetylase OafA/YrhL
VLGYHSLPGTFRGGFLGVDMFFVLSGFLLSTLLLDEHSRTGAIDRRHYAARRIRRLAPAGFVVLLALAIFGPLLARDASARLRGDIVWSALGLTNWHLIADGASYFSRTGRPPLVRHFWSLAIEVQFYLVCPCLIAWIARTRRRVAMAWIAAGIGASAFATWALYRSPDPYRAYYGTDTRIGALLAGVLLALLLQRDEVRRVLAWLAAPAALILAVLLFVTDASSRLLYPEGFLVTQAATMALIAAGLGGGGAAGALRARPLRWLGERSYGIYLWQWPLVALLRPRIDVSWPPLACAFVTISAALALGALSYRYVERPVLRGPRPHTELVRRHRLVAVWASAGVALVLLAVITLRIPANDPIAASLRAGEQVVAAQQAPAQTNAPGVSSSSRVPATRSNGGVLAAPRPRPGPVQPVLAAVPPVHVDTGAIGDSVMLGAAGPLHERLGNASYIDAKKNRQYREAVGVARDMRAKGRLGDVVVVHLGNNGSAKPADVGALLEYLRDRRAVLMVTVRVDKAWEKPNNDTYRAALRGHPNAKIVDWYAYSNTHRDWFWSDGTHLTPAGAREYAKLIAANVPAPAATPKPSPKPSPTPTPGLLPSIKPF